MHGTLAANEQFDPVGQFFTDTSDRLWYALLVVSGMERKACIWLRRRQYAPYWPRYRGMVKLNRHRRGLRYCSVIPGYLFLPLGSPDANWRLIREAPGIHGVLANADQEPLGLPSVGPQGIEKIREIENALNDSSIAAAEGIPFKRGQKVMIGRLELPGCIIRIDSRRKITVEAKLFGRVVRLITPVSELEAM